MHCLQIESFDDLSKFGILRKSEGVCEKLPLLVDLSLEGRSLRDRTYDTQFEQSVEYRINEKKKVNGWRHLDSLPCKAFIPST